ncbi:hypothetical protein [Clostridium sp. HBUAS56017]|nr:hypothetical protein [Clostridium sp. HBUAS56017]
MKLGDEVLVKAKQAYVKVCGCIETVYLVAINLIGFLIVRPVDIGEVH